MYSRPEKIICYSMAGSVVFHGLALLAYFNFVLLRPDTGRIVISNVDLIMQEKDIRAQARGRTLSFLRLALPAVPKITAPETPKMPSIDIKTPENRRRDPALPQQLPEREGKPRTPEKLDMAGPERAPSSLRDAAFKMAPEHGGAALAPKIDFEEVGLRKAPALPPGLGAGDDTRAITRPRDMAELNIAVSRAAADAAPQALSGREGALLVPAEAPPAVAPAGRLAPAPRDAAVKAVRAAPVILASALSLNRQGTLKSAGTEKKRMELTGPLSRRRILKFHVPPFPGWARERGLLEAAVSLKFYVDGSGRVLDNVTVETGSGYGALDRLAADAIKLWAFEPLDNISAVEWGVVTFRFIND